MLSCDADQVFTFLIIIFINKQLVSHKEKLSMLVSTQQESGVKNVSALISFYFHLFK